MKNVLVLHKDLTIEYKTIPDKYRVVEFIRTIYPTIVDINKEAEILPVNCYKLEIRELKYKDKSFYYAIEEENNDSILIIQHIITGKLLGIPEDKMLQLIKEYYE